jgi:lipopolysaccharide heptosyltransferase II
MRTVIRLPNWVGDTILALPAVEALAAGADVVVAGRPLPLLLTRHVTPGAPRIALGPGGAGPRWARDVAALRRARADRGVLLTPSLSSALWLWAGRVKERIGWGEQGRELLLTRTIERGPHGSRHLTDEFADLARAAGASVASPVPVLPESPEDAAAAKAFLDRTIWKSGPKPFVALAPGAAYGWAKQWPLEAYGALARRLARAGLGGIVVGSGPEQSAARQIIETAASPQWASATGAGSILVTAELLRRAAAVVSNDSGAMHVAAAVGAPLVALFGPTHPGWTGPRGADPVVHGSRLPCAPCFLKTCPYGRPSPCLAGIDAEQVAGEVLERAQRGGRRAIFLDRDGTLLDLVPYLHDPAQVRLVPGAAEALRAARQAGFALVVVTNQSGIARGLFREEDVTRVHARVQEALAPAGVAIDRFYHCPHHPDFTGPCDCRKPEPGLYRRAAAELGLDLQRSFAIGDTVEDLQAAQRAGCRPILVRTGYGAQAERVHADRMPRCTPVADDLPQALWRHALGAGGRGVAEEAP